MTNDKTPTPRKKLSAQQATTLLEFLADGVAHSMPLKEVFIAMADDLTDRRLKAVAKSLAEKIEAGEDPETAFKSLEPVLPNHMQRALSIGAKTGNLSSILAGLAESEVARNKMRRGMREVLAYPLLVLVLLMLLMAFASAFIIPEFTAIYYDFDLDLPTLTVILLQIANFLPIALLYLVLGTAVVLIVTWTLGGSRYLHWFRTAVPLFGRAWIWNSQHEFATLMATLTEQKIPATDALTCTMESLRDRNLARAARLARARCEQGDTLAQSLSDSIHFDPTLSSLVEWGEASQALPAALREAAHTYQQQMDSYIQFLRRIIPPFTLVLVATVLLISVAALLIPLVELTGGLSG